MSNPHHTTSPHAPVIAGVAADQPAVVRHALREAVRLNTHLRVVHCAAGHGDDLQVLEQARLVVQAHGRDVAVEYVLEHGDPAALLLEAAEDAQTRVVGADDAGWVEPMLGGDVSGHLASRAACPVVLVQHGQRGEGPVDGVVVALDGGTSSAGPLRYGFEQASFRREALHILHTVPVATTEADTASLTAKIMRDVAQWNLLTPGVQVKLSLATGDTVQECVEATAHASLLVIGRPHVHAYSAVLNRPAGMLVSRAARCPVAVVPVTYRSIAAPPAHEAV